VELATPLNPQAGTIRPAGCLAPSTVSAHLKELRNAGLTVERKEGKWVKVGLARRSESVSTAPGPTLDRLLGDSRVAADDHLVAELRGIPVDVLCRSGLDAARSRPPPGRRNHDG